MRCKNCDYALWNLTSRTCPECGEGFKPSEFSLNPNAVRFLCQHCGQQYFGTTDDGHLNPVEFDCVRCGRHIHMDEMVLTPGEGVSESLTRGRRADANPWLRRGDIGTSKAGWRTLGRVLGHPGSLMDAPSGQSGLLRQALWFSLLVNLLVGVASTIPAAGFVLLMGGMGGGMGMGVWVLVSMGLLPIAVMMLLWVVSGLLGHLLMLQRGGAGGGWRRSLEAGLYASGVNVLMAVPCMGMYLAPVAVVWGGVSLGLMFRAAHGVSARRAILAGLAVPVLCVGCAVVGFVVLVNWSSVIVSSARSTAGVSVHTASVARFMNVQPAQSNAWPSHGLELFEAMVQSGESIDSLDWIHDVSAVEVLPGIDEFDYNGYSPSERASLLSKAVGQLPSDVVAHRVGDMVFTYHGLGVSQAGVADRWLAVWSPHRGRFPARGGSRLALESSDRFIVIKGGWGQEEYDRASFVRALARENQARQAAGLPALPDLADFDWIATESVPGSGALAPIVP
ncbi:MAG: hypothetical protein ACTS3F_13635 [Phycisphaerales bacterium]